jgi:hypothetical protein
MRGEVGMTARRALHRSALLASVAVLAAAGLACADMLPGARGDGVADLNVAGRDLILRADGAAINGFILTSQAGLLTGDPHAAPAGLFVTDSHTMVADQFGFVLAGLHDLGRVVRPGVSFEDLQQDLTLTYTVEGLAGVYPATILPAIAGDADLNGEVGRADFLRLRQAFGAESGALWTHGDFTGDGRVDFLDYIVCKLSYGHTDGDGAVPEPASLLLLALGSLAMLRRRAQERV